MTQGASGCHLLPTAMYREPLAALRWLEGAFGFETVLLITDDAGALAHAETSFRGCRIGVAGEWEAPMLGDFKARSPESLGRCGTQFVWLELEAGVDAHCERARAAGARITQEPEDQFYGARTYRAQDPEGHVWCFRQPIKAVSVDEMAKSSGLKFQESL